MQRSCCLLCTTLVLRILLEQKSSWNRKFSTGRDERCLAKHSRLLFNKYDQSETRPTKQALLQAESNSTKRRFSYCAVDDTLPWSLPPRPQQVYKRYAQSWWSLSSENVWIIILTNLQKCKTIQKKKDYPFGCKGRCLDRYCGPAFHGQWDWEHTLSKYVFRPLQQECARGNKRASWYHKMICKTLGGRKAKHYRKPRDYQKNEIYHFSNALRNYMCIECTINRQLVHGLEEWLDKSDGLFRNRSCALLLHCNDLKNFKEFIQLEQK